MMLKDRVIILEREMRLLKQALGIAKEEKFAKEKKFFMANLCNRCTFSDRSCMFQKFRAISTTFDKPFWVSTECTLHMTDEAERLQFMKISVTS